MLAAGGTTVRAGSLSFECQGQDAGKIMTLSVVYDGEAEGKLTGKTSFGDVSFIASKKEGEEAYEGHNRRVVAIDASGPAKVTMPDAAALDECLTAEKNADDPDGELALLSCVTKVPDGAAPVPADVFIKLAIDPLVFQDSAAEIRRRYTDASTALGRKLTLEALPPLSCKSAKKE